MPKCNHCKKSKPINEPIHESHLKVNTYSWVYVNVKNPDFRALLCPECRTDMGHALDFIKKEASDASVDVLTQYLHKK